MILANSPRRQRAKPKQSRRRRRWSQPRNPSGDLNFIIPSIPTDTSISSLAFRWPFDFVRLDVSGSRGPRKKPVKTYSSSYTNLSKVPAPLLTSLDHVVFLVLANVFSGPTQNSGPSPAGMAEHGGQESQFHCHVGQSGPARVEYYDLALFSADAGRQAPIEAWASIVHLVYAQSGAFLHHMGNAQVQSAEMHRGTLHRVSASWTAEHVASPGRCQLLRVGAGHL